MSGECLRLSQASFQGTDQTSWTTSSQPDLVFPAGLPNPGRKTRADFYAFQGFCDLRNTLFRMILMLSWVVFGLPDILIFLVYASVIIQVLLALFRPIHVSTMMYGMQPLYGHEGDSRMRTQSRC